MSDESVSTSSVIKMKLLTWFSGYTVVSRTQKPKSGSSDSSKLVTEWCLAKPSTTEPQLHAAETSVASAAATSVTDPVSADPRGILSGEVGQAQVEAAAEDEVDHICPVNQEVQKTGPGSCPKCGAPLQQKEAE